MANAGDINAGYMGIVHAGGRTIRCTGMDIAPLQNPLFFDHVIGLNDTTGGSGTKGESPGTVQPQKTLMRPGPISVGGSISFPETEGSAGAFFEEAVNGGYLSGIEVYYDCKKGRSFSECRVDSYNMTITAGDMINTSVSFVGKYSYPGGGSPTYVKPEKFITWDVVEVNGSGYETVYGFNININNGVTPIYFGDTGDMHPADLRIGIQTVTGNILVYNDPGIDYVDRPTSISVNYPGGGFQVKCLLSPSKITGSVSPSIVSVPFTGIDSPFS